MELILFSPEGFQEGIMKVRVCFWGVFFAAVTAAGGSEQTYAKSSVQPYIDQVKKQWESDDSSAPVTNASDPKSHLPDSYIQSIKKKLDETQPATQSGTQPYIDRLKAENQKNGSPSSSGAESYIEQEKAKLEPQETGGAIQAVAEGRSELKAKKVGSIHHAFGFRYGLSLTRSYTAGSQIQARNFNDVYGQAYSPDLHLFYEFQPFHSEWFGNIGFFGMGGVGYNSGTGQFAINVPQPGGKSFSSQSQTKFQFFSVPIIVGANYRFNLLRWVRPYVFVGGSAIGFTELRNDGGASYRGASYGFYFALGTSISLDWFKESWDLYSEHGVKHYYLTLDYSKIATLIGDVQVGTSGFLVGLTFEY